MLLLYYTLAAATGYDTARTQNTKDRQKAIHGQEAEYSLLYEVISGKSLRKAVVGGFGLLLISGTVSLFTSPITGLTVAGSIGTILAFVLQLYPDEE